MYNIFLIPQNVHSEKRSLSGATLPGLQPSSPLPSILLCIIAIITAVVETQAEYQNLHLELGKSTSALREMQVQYATCVSSFSCHIMFTVKRKDSLVGPRWPPPPPPPRPGPQSHRRRCRVPSRCPRCSAPQQPLICLSSRRLRRHLDSSLRGHSSGGGGRSLTGMREKHRMRYEVDEGDRHKELFVPLLDYQ